MQKLENYTLQKFLDAFVNELKRENSDREYHGIRKLNIPFIISTLYQSFNNNTDKYKELISDLEKWSDYSLSIDKPVNDYCGIIDVEISLIKYDEESEEDFYEYDTPNYDYKLCFSYDERNWGYCECTPDMEDYREDKKCCGHGCDASFCSFSLHKIVNLGGDTDTIAAVCGGLSGIYYGFDSIPIDWLNQIPKIEEILSLCENYEGVINEY